MCIKICKFESVHERKTTTIIIINDNKSNKNKSVKFIVQKHQTTLSASPRNKMKKVRDRERKKNPTNTYSNTIVTSNRSCSGY